MKLLYIANSALWIANALMWALYARSTFMACASLAAAIGCAVFARQLDDYTF